MKKILLKKETITKKLEEITKGFLVDFKVLNPHEINRGLCYEWAEEVKLQIPQAEILEGDWNSRYYGHYWVKIRDLYYDAETLEGVEDWKNFPIFRRRGK